MSNLDFYSLRNARRIEHYLSHGCYPSDEEKVYLITDGKHVKIGVAKNVVRRLIQLQTGSPKKLRIMHSFAAGFECEDTLHKLFSHLRIRGEWFKLTNEIRNYIHNV